MGITKMDHVAIAVENIDNSAARWISSLGMEAGEVEELPERGVRLCKLTAPGSPSLELISPLGEDSPVARFLANLYGNQNSRGLAVTVIAGLLVFYSVLTVRQNEYWSNGIGCA